MKRRIPDSLIYQVRLENMYRKYVKAEMDGSEGLMNYFARGISDIADLLIAAIARETELAWRMHDGMRGCAG
jgi:predicted nucleic acid-binding protein